MTDARLDDIAARQRWLEDRIVAWYDNPVLFAQEVFGAAPDPWQLDVMQAAAREPKVALVACKGPGKSCVLAWLVWWCLVTRPQSQMVVCSITADNLRDNLWKELGYWRGKSSLVQEQFEQTAERIFQRETPLTWWCSARSFPKQADANQQANTLAGLHAQHVTIVLDEVGDYPAGVVAAAEAIFSNDVDAHLWVAGNPTRVTGPLYRIATVDRAKWWVLNITGDPDDPKRAPRISIAWAREQIDRWGRENPWVQVNVLGQFPPQAENSLISIDDVQAGMRRDMPANAYRTDAIVWGVDPARSGAAGADEAALARRQGILCRRFHTWRGKDGPELADAIGGLLLEADKANELPDAIFVDVGGVGASCYDHLKRLGWSHLVYPVDFGGRANDPGKYADKRSEMWVDGLAGWVHTFPVCLPNDAVLAAELTGPTFEFAVRQKRTVFILESKDDMKKRGLSSPNRADALALTFAQNVAPRAKRVELAAAVNQPAHHAVTDYDPYGGSNG